MPSDLDLYVSLTARKRELEQHLTVVKAQLAAAQDHLLEQFADEQVTAKRTAGGALVSTRRQIWARPVDGDKPRACRAMLGLEEFEHLVEPSFNTNTLSKIFRDRAKDGVPVADLLPVELQGVIALSEDIQLSVTGLPGPG